MAESREKRIPPFHGDFWTAPPKGKKGDFAARRGKRSLGWSRSCTKDVTKPVPAVVPVLNPRRLSSVKEYSHIYAIHRYNREHTVYTRCYLPFLLSLISRLEQAEDTAKLGKVAFFFPWHRYR